MQAVLSGVSALWCIREARVSGWPLEPVKAPAAINAITGSRDLARMLARSGAKARPPEPTHLIVPAGAAHTRSRRVRQQQWRDLPVRMSFGMPAGSPDDETSDFSSPDDTDWTAKRAWTSPSKARADGLNSPTSLLQMDVEALTVRRPEAGPFLPDGFCFATSRPGILALAPAPCVLTLARSWPVARLAMLVGELCGTFTLAPERLEFLNVAPAANIAGMQAFATKHPDHLGIKKMKQALRIATDNLASPLEAQVRTWLCAGLALGGCACGDPVANTEIDLGPGYGAGHGHLTARPDLYWPEARFGVECDGAQHDEARQYEKDGVRQMRLNKLGITEVRVSARSLRSYSLMRELGDSVRSGIGKEPLPDAPLDRERATRLWKAIVNSEWTGVPLGRVGA